MRNKISVSLLSLSMIVLGVFFALGAEDISAQTASFPAGCSSAIGYSITTGEPCSGTDEAISPLPGCPTVLGYSTVNGEPCSGSDVALSFLAGCTSIFGFSTITSQPCNGTTVASVATPPTIPVIPGLPTTGAGGEALKTIFTLILLAGGAVIGSMHLVRELKA